VSEAGLRADREARLAALVGRRILVGDNAFRTTGPEPGLALASSSVRLWLGAASA
jgi:hypothetical protein